MKQKIGSMEMKVVQMSLRSSVLYI